MPILGLILTVLVGAGYWWWRAQRARGAAETVIDLAGRAKGAWSRARFRGKAAASVLAGVNDPGEAAATLLYSLVRMKGPVSLADEGTIDSMLDNVCRMNAKDRHDAIAFAGWATGQVIDANEVVRRFLPLWSATLEDAQKHELMGMALDATEIGGPSTDAQDTTIRRLEAGLFPK